MTEETRTALGESVKRIRSNYLQVDMQVVQTCIMLIRNHVERSECRVGVEPEVSPELRSVCSMLEKLNCDMMTIDDVLQDYEKELS